jgi:hypothetical protein
VEARDAGAASGLVNAAHQLGGALGLAVLVVVFAGAAGAGPAGSPAAHAHQDTSPQTGTTDQLALSLAVVLATSQRHETGS